VARGNATKRDYTYKRYSQILDSNVSEGFDVREQKEASALQAMGSWKPQVPFRYLGWKNPVKPVSVPFSRKEV
jgi:hypothetical protein